MKDKPDPYRSVEVITLRKPILATRVSPYVNQSVRKLARGLGISISEYLRKLILQDLDSRKMFQDELKKAIQQPEKDERPRDKIIESLRRALSEDSQSSDDEDFSLARRR